MRAARLVRIAFVNKNRTSGPGAIAEKLAGARQIAVAESPEPHVWPGYASFLRERPGIASRSHAHRPTQRAKYYLWAAKNCFQCGQVILQLTLNYTNSGTAVVNLSVASNRQKKNGDGEKVSIADWYRVTVFGRDAEIISQYASKGSALSFNGRLQTDSYTDREGQQRTSIYLIADSFEFMPMPRRADDDAETPENTEVSPEMTEENKSNKKKRKGTKPEFDPSDIPF